MNPRCASRRPTASPQRFASAHKAGDFARDSMARHTLLRAMLLLALAVICLTPFAGAALAQNPPTTTPSTWNPGDLQAHGSDDRLWLARVEPVPGRTPTEITYVYIREKSDATWRRLEPLGLRVIRLANRGSQLALLLPGRDWRLAAGAGFADGGAAAA